MSDQGDEWYDRPHERRRGDEVVTHAEQRSDLQPLFDFKARAEPWLRFLETQRVNGIEQYLPELLKDERAREYLRDARQVGWRRLRNWAVVLAALWAVPPTIASVLEIGHVLRWWS